jgi:hypothetical protein
MPVSRRRDDSDQDGSALGEFEDPGHIEQDGLCKPSSRLRKMNSCDQPFGKSPLLSSTFRHISKTLYPRASSSDFPLAMDGPG